MVTEYVKPIERIFTKEDLQKWIGSSVYNELLKFTEDLQESVVGLTNNIEVHSSEGTACILKALDRVEGIVKENPVQFEKDVSRFGKVEFRDFYDQVAKESFDILTPLIETKKSDKDSLTEVAVYFGESWGDRSRIDYGSGHELQFVFFLLCLLKLNILDQMDYPFLVLKVFNRYISIMRLLQKTYWLEPAGSHGVWGLDDYHFLPFLFGASQLSTHPHLRPKSIHNDEMVETFYKDYMYMECIYTINSIKTFPKNQDQKLSLRWHSPMLDDISSARSWTKIKEGMLKMYKAEVLGKLPIIQHLMFGSILRAPDGLSDISRLEFDTSHGHNHVLDPNSINTWGDCCGIRIPSALAASESLRRNERKVPLD